MLKSWKHNFLVKRQTFQWRKNFGLFFSHFLEHNKGQETIFQGPQGLFDNCSAIDNFFSLGPKRSIARNFSKQKISCSHSDRRFWLTFHRLINCDKPPRTGFFCTQAFLTSTVEVIGSFLQDLGGCWKHNSLEKKRQFIQWGKNCGPIFLVFTSLTNLRGQFVRVHKVFWQKLRSLWQQFFRTQQVVGDATFCKKEAIFPVKKRFCPIFPPLIEKNKV